MGESYSKWLESEMAWVQELEHKMKKDAGKYYLLMPIAGAAVLGIIAVLSGGAGDLLHAVLRNALMGFVFGVVCIPLIYLLMLPALPVKKYAKSIKSEIEDVLSTEERENFAGQMLGTGGEVKCISWIDEEKLEIKVRVSKDYVLHSSRRGIALVQLNRVQNIEEDVNEYTVTGRGGGFKVTQYVTVYELKFFYQKSADGGKRNWDRNLTFSSQEIRRQVLQGIKELSPEIF